VISCPADTSAAAAPAVACADGSGGLTTAPTTNHLPPHVTASRSETRPAGPGGAGNTTACQPTADDGAGSGLPLHAAIASRAGATIAIRVHFAIFASVRSGSRSSAYDSVSAAVVSAMIRSATSRIVIRWSIAVRWIHLNACGSVIE